MSDLSFEFDLKSAETVINSLGVISGAMSITVDDRTTGNSVYDTLLQEIGPSSANVVSNVNATMFFQKHGSASNARFPFQVTLQGVEYDVINNKTRIQLLPPVWRSTNCNVHFASMPANYPQRTVVNESPAPTLVQFEGYFMGDVVEAYIATLDSGAGNQNVYRSGYNGPTASTNYFPEPGFGRSSDYEVGGDTVYYVGNTVYGFANTHAQAGGNDSILSKVISVAGMEGAVFGSAFSINFYTNRRNNKENITLSNSDLSDMKIVRGSQQVNAVNVRITPSSGIGIDYVPTFPLTQTQLDGSPLGSQFFGLQLVSHRPQFSRGVLKDDAQTPPVSPAEYINCELASTGSSGTWNTNNVAIAGAITYLGAFDLSSTTSERIEATILGVDKVKPYQVLKFGTDTPSRFQNKHFRPTSFKYNFKDDTIQVTAYKIP